MGWLLQVCSKTTVSWLTEYLMAKHILKNKDVKDTKQQLVFYAHQIKTSCSSNQWHHGLLMVLKLKVMFVRTLEM
jgi:hypothetical protein